MSPEIEQKHNEIQTTLNMINNILEILDEKERYIITEFYYKKEKADFICMELNCSRSYFFRKKAALIG